MDGSGKGDPEAIQLGDNVRRAALAHAPELGEGKADGSAAGTERIVEHRGRGVE